MKLTIETSKTIDVKTLEVYANVRYWEDATVNDIEDEEGDLIPCRKGDNWCPVIDLETGVILNWKKGVTADIHYKVCDEGAYYFLDETGKQVHEIEDSYVPRILCPKRDGYGDYIIMDVDANGQIQDWKVNEDALIDWD